MRCNSISFIGWQNVRNLRVRFNAVRYFCLKSSRIFSLLHVKDNKFNRVTRMLSTPSNRLNIRRKDLNMLGGGNSSLS